MNTLYVPPTPDDTTRLGDAGAVAAVGGPGERSASTPPPAEHAGGPSVAELRHELESLRRLVASLTSSVRQLQHPLGRVFLAAPTGTNGTFAEVAPDAGGTSIATLSDGRAVTATNEASLLLIPRGTNTAVLGFQNGTNACYVPISGGLDFYNGTVSAQLNAPLVSMGTNGGTASVLTFGTFSWTASGRTFSGASLNVLPGAGRTVLQTNAGASAVLWDFVRFHS